MTSGKTLNSFMKSLYIMAFAAPFLLTACTGSIEPGPMPTGYKYHNGVYKNQTGAEPGFWERGADNTGKNAQSRELAPLGTSSNAGAPMNYTGSGMNAEMTAWLPASRQLITRIKSRLGYPVEPTFFEGMNGQSIPGFEAALKTATSEQGWPTAPSRGEGPFHLAYSAEPAGSSGQMRLTVRLTVSANNFVIEEGGVYNILDGGAVAVGAPADLEFPVTVE